MTDSQQFDNSQNQQGNNLNDRAQINAQNLTQNFGVMPPSPRNLIENELLRAVWTEVAERQAFALHNRAYIEPDKRADPSQVMLPMEYGFKERSAAAVQCPVNMPVMELFDRPAIAGRLLIFGAPGSGKTTTLLQLAEVLLRRAIADGEQPVPVLLHLSSWKKGFRDIYRWMVAELKLKYEVKKSRAKRWIRERRIVPLLDGLDELVEDRQEACVWRLNEFLTEWSGSPLVVCSDLEAYRAYSTNLWLNGVVSVLPLSDGQIEWYLRQTGYGRLWEVIKDDSVMMDGATGLARSRLMLTMLVLVSESLQGQALERWLREENEAERQRLLFEAYVNRQLKRQYTSGLNLPVAEGEDNFPSGPYRDEARVRLWLGLLTRQLRETNQTEVFTEKLQPIGSLTTRRQKFVFGLIFGLFNGLFFGLLWGALWTLAYRLVYGLLFPLVGGLVWCSVRKPVSLEMLKKMNSTGFVVPKINFQNLVVGLLVGPAVGLLVGLLVSLVVEFEGLWRFAGVFGGFLGGVLSSFPHAADAEATTENRDNQSILQSLTDVAVYALTFALLGIASPVAEHFSPAEREVGLGTFFAFFIAPIGMIALGLYRLQSGIADMRIALRLTLCVLGYSPWNYSRFLRYCTERGFLQRVGGGYRFVHALLRDHFADTEPCPGDPTAPPAPRQMT
ncbi:MAG: NACHT domain-containing protein [Cyanobacteria bacterium P01_C01_bin.89]